MLKHSPGLGQKTAMENIYSKRADKPEMVDLEMDSRLSNILTEGLLSLPDSKASARFSEPVLSALRSRRDFSPWYAQILTRFRWMLLPAILGFAALIIICMLFGKVLPELPEKQIKPAINLGAPPMLPLSEKNLYSR